MKKVGFDCPPLIRSITGSPRTPNFSRRNASSREGSKPNALLPVASVMPLWLPLRSPFPVCAFSKFLSNDGKEVKTIQNQLYSRPSGKKRESNEAFACNLLRYQFFASAM